MKIVTDSGADLIFPQEVLDTLDVKILPLVVNLENKSYREDIDITTEQFYKLLEQSKSMPTTSLPPTGDFADVYRELGKDGEEILSIHISSGLSGTFNSAVQGAEMVPEVKVTHYDAKTLSAAVGWMVEAASRAIKAGWSKEKILELLDRIREGSESIYTLKELKYLINGGRISHMKGLVASLLNIKPIIGVEKETGTYAQLGQERTFNRALDGLVNQMKKLHAPGSRLRVQVLHSFNHEGAAQLKEKIDQVFNVSWLPTGSMSLVLGAHTGPSMVGVAYAPQEIFDDLP
ncbi:MAG TPA: DegV family protein [Anaerolineales bacterium]|jgi:DegV family protein with EDD domain|nr:DegV family protein [Anaerolineales bacterium]